MNRIQISKDYPGSNGGLANQRRRMRAVAVVLGLGAAVLGCGGGGGSGPVFTVGGTISGLRPGLSVTVVDSTSGQQATATANGSYSAAANLANGAAYSLNITAQPLGQLCTAANASGIVAAASVTTATITCVDALTDLAGNAIGLGFGLATNTAGDVFVADASVDVVFKISPAGVTSVLAGAAGQRAFADGAGATARFDGPYGIAADGTGDLFVADTSNQTIRKVTPQGAVSTIAGSAGQVGDTDGPGTAARFRFPSGIAVDSAGNLYVTDENGHRVRKISPAGDVTTIAGNSARLPGSADGTGTAASFNAPIGVTTDSLGNVYVADRGNHTIRKITPQAEVTTLAGAAGQAGSADGTGANARFNKPWGLVADSAGNLYVSDRENHTVRKISPLGVVSTVIGQVGVAALSLGPLPAGLSFPSGIALNDGRLFVNTGPNTVVWVYAP